MSNHLLNKYLASVAAEMANDYETILSRVSEDPGTAGDQGEENWKDLLKGWLPPIFQIVTKGRIIDVNGQSSPQIDVLILRPEYPTKLLGKKYYLASGVVAAFECKTTLKSNHFKKFFENSVAISRLNTKRSGSPFKELHCPIIYGLLAHSHDWKKTKSKAFDNVKRLLNKYDKKYVMHPYEMPSIICISDLLTIHSSKCINLSQSKKNNEEVITTYFCCPMSLEQRQKDSHPIGTLLSSMLYKMAWEYPNIRPLADYFREANVGDVGAGEVRFWSADVFSNETRGKVLSRQLSNKVWDEWCIGFM
ncbi:MAG: hypothetical protein Q8K00_18500 [Syntrophales bacterium]|nr:hypothetical protein [Syntrophales bacterium]